MTDTDEQHSIQPTAILASRRWHSALFTTYAFSVSFFESVVLQALSRKTSCPETAVIVDVDGYASSLMERGATKVGRDYTLIPVLVPGVFHPKCTYLAGPDGDLLLVGSGNLTFGGYGRNVEVLEVLQPDKQPQAFLDFADFLESLITRPLLEIPNPSCVSAFIRRAREVAAGDSGSRESDPIRLLHSCDESIAVQLSRRALSYGPVRRITVLSPFHDANGKSLPQLTRSMQCDELRIALPPNPEQVTTFPFHLAFPTALNISAVISRLETDSTRPLHAKWIDIDLPGGRLTLTGSVNATYPALWTTKNIEVGILRFTTSPVERWDSTAIPSTKPLAPELLSAGSRPRLVYANLTAGGQVAGHVLRTVAPAGQWRLRFERPTRTYLDRLVEVDADGRFRSACDKDGEILTAGTIRVRLNRNEEEAIGWLEMDELVRMSPEERGIFSALSRFVSRQATEDDDLALLNYLAISSFHHLDDLTAEEPLPSGKTGQAGQRDKVTGGIPLSRVAPSSEEFNTSEPKQLGVRNANTLSQWFRQFRDEVLSPGNAGGSARPSQPEGAAHPSEEDGEPEGQEEQARISLALLDFDRRMQKKLHETADTESRRKLLCIWHEVTILMLCQRLATPEECPVFLRRWLWSARELVKARESPGALEKLFFTSVATLAFHAMQEESRRALQSLHEGLEFFCRKAVNSAYAHSALDRRWELGIARSILGIEAPSLDEYLDAVLKTKTSLDEVQELLTAMRDHAPVHLDSGIFNAPHSYGQQVGAELRAILGGSDPSKFIVPRLDDQFGRDCCNLRFPEIARANYLSMRIARCTRCRKFNLRLVP